MPDRPLGPIDNKCLERIDTEVDLLLADLPEEYLERIGNMANDIAQIMSHKPGLPTDVYTVLLLLDSLTNKTDTMLGKK